MPKPLTLYGNILDNPSRNIMAMCNFCQVKLQTITIDFLKPASIEAFKKKSITGHIPMIEEGKYQVLGGNHMIYIYLARSKQDSIGTTLLPDELEKNIKGIIGWHQARMMIPCQQIFRYHVEPNVFPTEPTAKMRENWMNEVKQCMKTLDESLIKNKN